MKQHLSIRLLMREYKFDTVIDHHLFNIDTSLKLAGLFMLTASLWAFAIQRGNPPTYPPYVPIFLCIDVYILLTVWLLKNIYRIGQIIWNHRDFFAEDLASQFDLDRQAAQSLANRFEFVSLKACQLELEAGTKRFEKDVASLGPLSAVSGATTAVLAQFANTWPQYPWILTIISAFMLGFGSAAILKHEFTKRLTRYGFIVEAALRLADDN
jgi:hypothetical protein